MSPWKNPQLDCHIGGWRDGGNQGDSAGRQDLLFSPKTNAQTTLAALNRENYS